MDAMAEIRQTFFEECADGLGELEAGLLAIENGATDYETVNTVFRAVHSIKGGAASFNLDELTNFALMFEAVLDELRSGRLAASPELLLLARRAATVLDDLVAAARDDRAAEAQRMRDMMDELRPFGGAKAAAISSTPTARPEVDDGMEGLEFTPVAIDLLDMFGAAFETRHRIVFQPMPELYRNANEASRLLRDCLALGTGTVTCDASALPSFDAIDPEGAYLNWTVDLTSTADERRIREVFEFAEWDCELTVEAIADEPAADNPADGASLDATFAALLSQIQSEASAADFVTEDEESEAETA